MAIRLTSSDSPCSVSRAKPAGIRAQTGQRIRPPASPDVSPLMNLPITTGQESRMEMTQKGRRKNRVPKISIQIWVRREQRP
jgi:hypothetical protein